MEDEKIQDVYDNICEDVNEYLNKYDIQIKNRKYSFLETEEEKKAVIKKDGYCIDKNNNSEGIKFIFPTSFQNFKVVFGKTFYDFVSFHIQGKVYHLHIELHHKSNDINIVDIRLKEIFTEENILFFIKNKYVKIDKFLWMNKKKKVPFKTNTKFRFYYNKYQDYPIYYKVDKLA